MDRPHSRSQPPIGEGAGGAYRQIKRLSQRNLDVLQASSIANRRLTNESHHPSPEKVMAGPLQPDTLAPDPILRFTHSHPKEEPFPLYAREAQNARRGPECTSASAQDKKRERSASITQSDSLHGGSKRLCPTSAGTEPKRRLVCPYARMFPRQHLPDICFHGFPTSFRVKEHLFRRHFLPEDGDETRIQANTASHGVTFGSAVKAQFERGRRGSTEIEKWMVFWRILFPDAQEDAPSPYLEENDDSSSTEQSQLVIFQATQYDTLPQLLQVRCTEAMTHLSYAENCGVNELINLLPGLLRDAMEANGFTPTDQGQVHPYITAVQQPFSTANYSQNTPVEVQAGPSSHEQTDPEYPGNSHRLSKKTSQPDSLNCPHDHAFGTTRESGYYSESLRSHSQNRQLPHAPVPAAPPVLQEPESNHGHQYLDSSGTNPDNVLSAHQENYYDTTYPSSWDRGVAMASLMPQGQLQQEQQQHELNMVHDNNRSPTDFAGGWTELFSFDENYSLAEDIEFDLGDPLQDGHPGVQ